MTGVAAPEVAAAELGGVTPFAHSAAAEDREVLAGEFAAELAGSELAEAIGELAQEWSACTPRSPRAPHCRPVWGVWLADGFWFSTGSLARLNLVGNPHITSIWKTVPRS